MKHLITFLTLGACLFAAAPAGAQSLFTGDYTIVTRGSVGTIASADLNNDGAVDVAMADNNARTVVVALSNGNGTFAPSVRYPIGVTIYSVTFGLIDNDGYPDLLVGSDNNDLRVYLNDGAGAFVLDTVYDVGNDIDEVALADFDHDSDLDLVGLLYTDILVMFNDGTGRFTSTTTIPAGDAGNTDVAAVDIDNDTYADIVMCGFTRDSVYVRLNDQSGAFGSPVAFYVGDNPLSATVADLNGDLYPDLAIANRFGTTIGVRLGQAGSLFGPLLTYSGPTDPNYIAAGDFDNDGFTDLAVACFQSETVAIMRNNQDGSFTFERSFRNPDAYSITVDHFNDDANLDVAVSFANEYCRIMYGDGNGNFPQTNTDSIGTGVYDFACADIDGDNDLDVVGSNSAAHRISVVRNEGNAVFAARSWIPVGTNTPAEIIVADMDNTNGPDIVFSNLSRDTVCILRNEGGGFYPSIAYLTTGDNPARPVAADFNGDTWLDLAVPNIDGYSVSVFLNNQDSTFTDGIEYPVVNEAWSVAAVDYDGDLDQDLVVAVHGWPDYEIAFFENDGSGSFTAGTSMPMDIAPAVISAADIDNDGDLDLAVGVDADSLYIYVNDGAGNFSGPVIYPQMYYCFDPKFADVDKDGDLDILVHHGGYYYFSLIGNDGDGTFAPPLTWFYGDVLADVEFADMDNDSYLDIVGLPAEYCYDSLMLVYMNQAQQIPTEVIDGPPDALPSSFGLAAWPNPFNPSQIVSFTLPRRAHVKLDVYNVLGRKVRSLIDCELPSGETRAIWDGRSDSRQPVASGIYFYRLDAGEQSRTLKSVLVR